MSLIGPSRRFRHLRFGWERTLVNGMPDERKIGIEVNPKGRAGKPIIRGTPQYASSSSNALASFRSSVSKPSVNQP
jgi:hypothetical protein